MTNRSVVVTHMFRLLIIILFFPFSLMPAHGGVPSLDSLGSGNQSTTPFLTLAHLELDQDFWSKLLDTSSSTGAVLDSFYSDSKLNTFFSKAEPDRLLSESECGRLRELMKAGFLHISKDIIPGQFWEEELARFYSNVLTIDEAESYVASHQNLSGTPSESKLKQLRTAFVRDVLPDLVPQMRSMAQSFKIPSGGMAPSLLAGDHFIVNKLAYQTQKPGRGDVIVFKYPEDESLRFVKRIIGLPGDKVEIRDKIVHLNGQILRRDDYPVQHVDPKIIQKAINPRDSMGPVIVLDDSYFVLGDNRDQSLDSRFWGFVRRDQIIGKTSIIYWSWDETTKTARWDRAGKTIR